MWERSLNLRSTIINHWSWFILHSSWPPPSPHEVIPNHGPQANQVPLPSQGMWAMGIGEERTKGGPKQWEAHAVYQQNEPWRKSWLIYLSLVSQPNWLLLNPVPTTMPQMTTGWAKWQQHGLNDNKAGQGPNNDTPGQTPTQQTKQQPNGWNGSPADETTTQQVTPCPHQSTTIVERTETGPTLTNNITRPPRRYLGWCRGATT